MIVEHLNRSIVGQDRAKKTLAVAVANHYVRLFDVLDRESNTPVVVDPGLRDAPADLADRGRWKGLAAIGVAINISTRDGEQTDAVRYYILSRRLEAKEFAEAVRSYWGIENSLHWQLDVSFGEDACRVRIGLADANLSVVRRAALGLLKNEKSEKIGVRNKRLAAACNTRYMEKVLTGS